MYRLLSTLIVGFFFAPFSFLVSSCAETETTLLIELVPNPEVNTRADVAEHINSLEVVFDAQGGFASLNADDGDSWGAFSVVDFDSDGVLELLLIRPGRTALEVFAISQGSQDDRVINITARGMSTEEDAVTALGATSSAFQADHETQVEVPFNLVPEYRPLRVLSMVPSQGARDLPSPVYGITVQLGGEVLDTALEGQVELHANSVDQRLAPSLSVSYIDSGMGRLTNVRVQGCELFGGDYTVILRTEICSRTGRCLDQELGLDGSQPFIGGFSVSGDPVAPDCEFVTVLGSSCPQEPCAPGYYCDFGICLPEIEMTPYGLPEDEITCDPDECGPLEELVCDPVSGCVPSCLLYGACVNPLARCDLDSGLCIED